MSGWRTWKCNKPRPAGLSNGGRLAMYVLAGGLLLMPLGGFNKFFRCENKPACPADGGGDSGGGSTGHAVDLAFVAATAVSADGKSVTSTVTGYDLGSGDLKAINSVTLPFVPVSMVVNPKNSLLYVGSVPGASNPGVYAFAIGSDNKLSPANGGAALATDYIGAMAISPDGNFLYTLESLGQSMNQFSVQPDGSLKNASSLPGSALPCTLQATNPVLPACSVTVSPRSTFVAAAYGTQGDFVFPFGASAGVTSGTPTGVIQPAAGSGDFSVAIDGNDNAYLAQTSSVSVYRLSALNTAPATIPLPTGAIVRSLVVDPQSKFVFGANPAQSTIMAYAIGSSTALTAVAGQPFAGPASVAAVGADSTNSYLVAAGYDSGAGVQLYAISGSGVLSKIGTSQGTSAATQFPVLVAMSH